MGLLAATASGDFSVKVWDAITGDALWEFPHKHIVKTCDFSPDSSLLATGGHEGLLRIYTLPEPTPQVIPQDSKKNITITKCNWWKDDIVLAAGNDGLIRFWNLRETEKPMAMLQVDAEVRDMELSADQSILTVAAGNKVSFFDLGKMTLIHSYPMPIHFRDVRTCVCVHGLVFSVVEACHSPCILCFLYLGGRRFAAPVENKICGGGKRFVGPSL
jgi:serine-threonine kinase receptor-associated protein